MQYQHYPQHGQYQNYPQTIHLQNFPHQQVYNGGLQQPHNQHPSQQMIYYRQTHPQSASAVPPVCIPPYMNPNNNRHNRKSKNGTQHPVQEVHTSTHPVQLVHTHKKANGKTHPPTVSHINAQSTPAVAASATPHSSAKSTTSEGKSTGSVASTKSGPKVRNQNYATKMLSESHNFKGFETKKDILTQNTVRDEEIDNARQAYKDSLENAMKVKPKD